MSCESGKTEFTSRRSARRALRSLRHPHGRMHVYKCGGHWHFGHSDILAQAKRRRAG